jgi:transposase, IS30 family
MPYTHLSAVERGKIELLHQQGWSAMRIGQEIDRHHTTVSRELARNGSAEAYRAEEAQARYAERRQACRPRYRLAFAALRERVESMIAEEGMTPELAAGRLRVEYPHDGRMRVCHESIYQAIYANRFRLDYLIECLPQARPKRRRRGQGKTRRGPSIANRVSIHERAAEVNERGEPGHWEADLVVGRNQESFLLTLVERHARITIATKLSSKQAGPVAQAIIEALEDMPISWVKSIAFDNGTEFAEHERVARVLGIPTYFADPYSSYQRGSNEQVNGLLRRDYPKGTCFHRVSRRHLQTVVHTLNNRPRKCLQYRTPNEIFQQHRNEHRRALSS